MSPKRSSLRSFGGLAWRPIPLYVLHTTHTLRESNPGAKVYGATGSGLHLTLNGAWGHIFILGVYPTAEEEYAERDLNSPVLATEDTPLLRHPF